MNVEKRYLSWDDVEQLTLRLARSIKASRCRYDVLIGIARGGIVPAGLLAQVLDNNMVLTADQLHQKRVLIIDEVHDLGDTLVLAKQVADQAEPLLVHTAVLHFKPGRNRYAIFKPTYYAETTADWIVYPWEQFADKVAAHQDR